MQSSCCHVEVSSEMQLHLEQKRGKYCEDWVWVSNLFSELWSTLPLISEVKNNLTVFPSSESQSPNPLSRDCY